MQKLIDFVRNSIRVKLLIVLLVPILLFVGLVYFVLIPQANQMANQLIEHTLTKKLQGDMNSAWYYLREHYGEVSLRDGTMVDENGNSVAGNHSMVDHIQKDLEITSTIFVKDGDDYRRITTSIRDQEGERVLGTYLGQSSAAYEPIRNGERYIGEADILGTSYFTGYDPIIRDGRVIGILYVGIPEDEARGIAADAMSGLNNYTLYGLLIVIVLGSGITIYTSNRFLVHPIRAISEAAQRIADGDLRQDDIRVASDDEIGRLGDSFNDLSNRLRSFIGDIQEIVDEIDQASASVSSSSVQLSEQSEELTSITRKTSENTSESTSLSNTALESVEQGREDVDELASTMEKINEDARSMEEAVDVISNITQRTKLLALNAAVEAARAGEDGEGFAVVAEEVKQLSQQSAEAAEEIEENIRTSIDRAQKGVQRTENSQDILNEIFEQVSQVTTQMEEIASATDEQTTGIDQINEAIDELKEISESMRDVVEQLRDSADHFRI